MRLLDLIAQSRAKPIRADTGHCLPGVERFKHAILACPIRFVFADDLTRSATQLAYAAGERLTSCLDLIHVPAQSLWVEWAEGPRQDTLRTIAGLSEQPPAEAQRAGSLLTSKADGRSGEIRTFWSTREQQAYVSPVITRFDLDAIPQMDEFADPAVGKGLATLVAPPVLRLDEFLDHVRFGLDAEWSQYYLETCVTSAMRRDVLRANMATCAFDPPMLFAFFLMLCARNALPRRTVSLERLNRSRSKAGKPPLLEHIELAAPLFANSSSGTAEDLGHAGTARQSPRLHHVCGHIVRRGPTVFWRSTHLRGSARLGQVRSRTVALSFAGSERPSIARVAV